MSRYLFIVLITFAVGLIAFGILMLCLNLDGANIWRPIDNHGQCYVHQTQHRSWSSPDHYTRTTYCKEASR